MNNADPSVGILSLEGIDFRYVREGVGPPIVVIGSSTYYPRAFSPELRQHFELIFVDSRHFIPTYRPTNRELESLSLETWADDIETLRIQFGIDTWAVLGHSIHAQIALAYERKYPERTTELILVAGVPYSFAELEEVRERFWNEHAFQDRKDRHARNRRGIEGALAATHESRRFVVGYVGDAAMYWVDATYDSTPLWEGVETGPAFGRLAEIVPSRERVKEMLEGIETRTLLILGQLDYACPHVAWEDLVRDLPSLNYVLLEGESHNPQTEAPQRFDRELTSWMSNAGEGA